MEDRTVNKLSYISVEIFILYLIKIVWCLLAEMFWRSSVVKIMTNTLKNLSPRSSHSFENCKLVCNILADDFVYIFLISQSTFVTFFFFFIRCLHQEGWRSPFGKYFGQRLTGKVLPRNNWTSYEGCPTMKVVGSSPRYFASNFTFQ